MSFDVENLFTNVPIDRTIDIILDCTYHNDRVTPPKIPDATLKQLLTICTKEAPFRHVDGHISQQLDGIAISSPLGCAFANFYMESVEIKPLNEINEKPILYARNVDDILLVVNSVEQMHAIQTKFIENSVLKFFHE